jgi:radical SAM/Cys-rich protein
MANATTSLRHRGERLAKTSDQLVVLTNASNAPRFESKLHESGLAPLRAECIKILQVNLGKLCNMTCDHCHVDAGPDRREIMQRVTIDACLDVLRDQPRIKTLDLTGGAPEMNPHFRDIVRKARALGRHVIDRCNLTILLAKGYEDMPDFLAEHEVEIVASLPCYLEENTDAQRGGGAFKKSLEALRRLNDLGYGVEGSGRMLTLVYNPIGASLPPDQRKLEAAYHRELDSRYGVRFNRLFTITNMPISRFLDYLVRTDQHDQYMQALVDAFNLAAVSGLMCRSTLSVGWDGRLYDCDFNQMLEIGVSDSCPTSIRDFDNASLFRRVIAVGQQCYGCTAGAGSGCQGALS